MLYWTEDNLESTLSLQAEKITLYSGAFYYSTWEQGISQFDVCIEESLINLRDRIFVQVVYRDHTYTLTHFQNEYQGIINCSMCWVLLKMSMKLINPKEDDM